MIPVSFCFQNIYFVYEIILLYNPYSIITAKLLFCRNQEIHNEHCANIYLAVNLYGSTVCLHNGLVTGGGISAPNEAGNHKNAMQKAYELGKRL